MNTTIDKYHIDAFSSNQFGGNPAAVCVLDEWLDDTILQKIAAEHNLSETAFIKRKNDNYHIRWFTPTIEVKLCGHATLASAYVVKEFLKTHDDKVIFESLSGLLEVDISKDELLMKFPLQVPQETEFRTLFMNCFNENPAQVLKGEDFYLFEYDNIDSIKSLKPDFSLIALVDNALGIIVTAKGDDCDYVCRLFAPAAGINEDPATGSIQTSLAPFWMQKLGKAKMTVKQLSKRGGELVVEVKDDFVYIGGHVQLYSKGEIYL